MLFRSWLRAGGGMSAYPWRPNAQASSTKALLIEALQRAAKPHGISVDPATGLYP